MSPPDAGVPGRPGRPPGYRPPGYRPPGWRPPSWRPPYFRPPYVRPPHFAWGRYYWHPSWGWYHTALVAGATLAFIATLPNNGTGCEEIRDQGETIYVCNGVVYRASYYQDERVYEIVSSDEDSPRPETPPVSIPESDTDEFVELRLESPFLRGDRVRLLQTSLDGIGFNVGRIDGIFGRDTDTAVRDFQDWYGLPVTGVVDIDTANAIIAEYAAVLAPPPEPTDAEADQSAPERALENTNEATQDNDDTSTPEPASENPAPSDVGQQDAGSSNSEPESDSTSGSESESEQESESESSN